MKTSHRYKTKAELIQALKKPISPLGRKMALYETVEAYIRVCKSLKDIPLDSPTPLSTDVVRELEVIREGLDTLGDSLTRLIENFAFKETDEA